MNDEPYATHPDLEPRFLAPPGWRWHMFAGHNGKTLRFGSVFPKAVTAKAVVVILPGLREFGETYFELANNFLDRDYATYVIDWQGQGRSHRHLKKHPHKRISSGFENDVKDLDILIKDYILPSAVHPEVGRLPLVMLAHSMGGNIGLRYLHQHPDTFTCAAFSAPMIGIKALKIIPRFLRLPIARLLYEFCDASYVPKGSDFSPSLREGANQKIFSSDAQRAQIHNIWAKFDPALQVGSATYNWVYHAVKSCQIVDNSKFIQSIKTPIFMALAGKELLVSNRAIRRTARQLPHCKLLELPKARHEIIMESNTHRNKFLKAFDDMIKTHILDVKGSTKPF